MVKSGLMAKIIYIILFFSILIANNSCEKVKSYSPIPAIEIKSYNLIDVDSNKIKRLTIEFSFVDGDGDLFSPQDTINKDSLASTLFWTYFEKVDGVFVQVSDSSFKTPLYLHFPYSDVMQRNGQNKTQKGTFEYTIDYFYPMPYDTMEIEFYVVDVALHKSNVVRTPNEIILK